VLYKSVKYAGAELGEKDNRRSKDADPATGSPLKPHVFNLSVDATYDQLKGLLRLLEQNNYPLEVHALDIQKSEGGFLNVSLDLVTYSFEADIISDDSEVTSYE
jgi:hypothetical protein